MLFKVCTSVVCGAREASLSVPPPVRAPAQHVRGRGDSSLDGPSRADHGRRRPRGHQSPPVAAPAAPATARAPSPRAVRAPPVSTAAAVTKRINEHTTNKANRIIAATNAGTATLERRFDRMEANLASRSSGCDELLERLVGQPGSSKEIQAEIDARKEDLKRKRREEREEEKQAEKRRKLEQLLEIPLEEGDTLQDGVVLRGDLGRRKMHGLQAVGDFPFGRLR